MKATFLSVFILAFFLTVIAAPAAAQDIYFSPDITIDLLGMALADEDLGLEMAGGVVAMPMDDLPQGVDLKAFHIDENGDFHFVMDTAGELPGGIIADGRDIVRFDGVAYDVVFDGSAKGVPSGVELDALFITGGDLFFSFDIDAEIAGELYPDEDLVQYDGSFQVVFKGNASGVPKNMDLDAATLSDGDLVLSFDIDGVVGGAFLGDEDGGLFDGGSWSLLVKGEAYSADFFPADLDALHIAGITVDPGIIFTDDFEGGNSGNWTQTVN